MPNTTSLFLWKLCVDNPGKPVRKISKQSLFTEHMCNGLKAHA